MFITIFFVIFFFYKSVEYSKCAYIIYFRCSDSRITNVFEVGLLSLKIQYSNTSNMIIAHNIERSISFTEPDLDVCMFPVNGYHLNNSPLIFVCINILLIWFAHSYFFFHSCSLFSTFIYLQFVCGRATVNTHFIIFRKAVH